VGDKKTGKHVQLKNCIAKQKLRGRERKHTGYEKGSNKRGEKVKYG